jgi:hypothetical protein
MQKFGQGNYARRKFNLLCQANIGSVNYAMQNLFQVIMSYRTIIGFRNFAEIWLG